MENIDSDDSWLNENNERHNIIIQSMVREGLLGSNQHENKQCCAFKKQNGSIDEN